MKIGFIASNVTKISQFTKKGSEIFDYIFLTQIAKIARKQNLDLTVFASGDSQVPAKLESINYYGSFDDKSIGNEHHKIFEIALLSKAIARQSKFDILHLSVGDGEIALPFLRYIRKPVVITMHGPTNQPFQKKLFPLYRDHFGTARFVSVSNFQRKGLPYLPYVRTIYHGIDTKKFSFNPEGGKQMIWTGRAIPEKGLDVVLRVAKKMKKPTKIFPIIKEEYIHWLMSEVLKKRDTINQIVRISIDFDVKRYNLIKEYQSSKLFIFPVDVEESFGLTLAESLACGTPVVAYARGSVSEIVKDGVTGFIVNQSPQDIRGNWIVKKTGFEGLCEAVERIYALPEDKYREMRLASRRQAETLFSHEWMVEQYLDVYNEMLSHRKAV